MTLNSDAEKQSRPVSTKSCAEVSSNEGKMKAIEIHPDETSERNEINKSELREDESEKNSTAKDQHKGTAVEPLQHEITTIIEESERDENNAMTLDQRDRTETQTPVSENICYDTDIEDMKEQRRGGCRECLTDVFQCMIWYYRNVKNFMTLCFRRCGDCKFSFCCNNGSIDSEEPDVNYVYGDLNETFNKDLDSDDAGINIVDVVKSTTSNTNECTVSHESHVYHYNSGDDTGNDNTGSGVGHDNSGGDGGCHTSGGDGGCYSSGGDGGGDSGGGSCD